VAGQLPLHIPRLLQGHWQACARLALFCHSILTHLLPLAHIPFLPPPPPPLPSFQQLIQLKHELKSECRAERVHQRKAALHRKEEQRFRELREGATKFYEQHAPGFFTAARASDVMADSLEPTCKSLRNALANMCTFKEDEEANRAKALKHETAVAEICARKPGLAAHVTQLTKVCALERLKKKVDKFLASPHAQQNDADFFSRLEAGLSRLDAGLATPPGAVAGHKRGRSEEEEEE